VLALGLHFLTSVVGLDPAYVLRSLLLRRVDDGVLWRRAPIPWIGRFDPEALLTISRAPPVDAARVSCDLGERDMLARCGIRGSLDGWWLADLARLVILLFARKAASVRELSDLLATDPWLEEAQRAALRLGAVGPEAQVLIARRP
jgi:hypothetical protein